MNVLVIGSGGSEHAVIKALKKNKQVREIFALPGNGGIAAEAECFPIEATDIDGIVEFAKTHEVDFAVVMPAEALVLGCVDRLKELGIPCFGPRANAAIIEGSKVFSKTLMKKYGIPTASGEAFSNPDDAIAYLKNATYPIVVKADGLAFGKGVIIAVTYEEAEKAVRDMMCEKVFGESGNKILIEEHFIGVEVSVLTFTDGKTVVPMVSAMDHKRALDGDEGLNTGGMGTVAPNPYFTKEAERECMERIFLPTVRAMRAEGRLFKGCLYFGLMFTKYGPKVIEYNCRFGDPEAQVVLPLLRSDLLEIMMSVAGGTLSETPVQFSDGAACCVVLAPNGYPQAHDTGYEITLPETSEGEEIFVAGATRERGRLYTAGGRALGAVKTAKTLAEAVKGAYELADKIHFDNAYMRRDIGTRALEAIEE